MPEKNLRRMVLRALAVLAVLGLLAGCGGTPGSPVAEKAKQDQKRPEIKAGTCWTAAQLPEALSEDGFADWVKKYAGGDEKLGRSMRDDAAFADRLDCAEPHGLEVYNVVRVTPKLTARIKQYADLLDPSSKLYREVRDQVNNRCAAGSPYGKAQRKAGLPVQLGPALAEDSGLHVAWDPYPADLWEKGQHKFVCTFQQQQPGTLRYADLTTRKVPVKARICLNTPGKFVPCRKPHQAEDVAEMILNTVIAQGKVDGRKAVRKGPNGKFVALSDAEYRRLDKVCQTFLNSVSSKPHGVSARAYPGSVDQWPTENGSYVASCFALRPYEPPPKFKGTVFDRG